MLFNQVPSGELIGDEFGEDMGFDAKKITEKFQVIHVHGRVRWQVQGPSDASAMLILKRKMLKSKKIFGHLDLANYVSVSLPQEVSTAEFDFKPDLHDFWKEGAAGKIAFGLTSLPQAIHTILTVSTC